LDEERESFSVRLGGWGGRRKGKVWSVRGGSERERERERERVEVGWVEVTKGKGKGKGKRDVLVLVEEVVGDLLELGEVRAEEAGSELGKVGVVWVVDSV
jgi:hypothetical protein